MLCIWRHHELFKWSTRLCIYKNFKFLVQTQFLHFEGVLLKKKKSPPPSPSPFLDSPWLICSWTPFLPFSCSSLRSRGLPVSKGHMPANVLLGSAVGSTCRWLEDRKGRIFLPHSLCLGCCFLIVVIPDEPLLLWLELGDPAPGFWKRTLNLLHWFRGRNFLCC